MIYRIPKNESECHVVKGCKLFEQGEYFILTNMVPYLDQV